MANRRQKAEDYPAQTITKRGIVELHMSPVSMHEFLTRDLQLPRERVIAIARAQMADHPRRETFWKLVAYNAMSDGT